MNKTMVLVGALDTRGGEINYVKKCMIEKNNIMIGTTMGTGQLDMDSISQS